MRNLKKILALVLALVMSFSLMATASAFSDDGDIAADYAEAIDVLSGLEVFKGYDNGATFQPKGSITRAEVAAIIYRIATGDVKDAQTSIYSSWGQFNDVKDGSWYAGYVNYCANAGYIKGYDSKTFGPNDPVTGYQALAMILRAIGYDKNNEFTGSNWQVRTASIAKQRGITDDVTDTLLGQAATRELVAEVLFQSILVKTVTFNTNTLSYSENATSLGYDVLKLEKIEGVVVANQFADLADDEGMATGKTRIESADGDRTLNVVTTLDDIGESRYAYGVKTSNNGYNLVTEKMYDTGDNVIADKGEEIKVKDLAKEQSISVNDNTEYFVNFDQSTDKWTSEYLIRYAVAQKSITDTDWQEFLRKNAETKSITYYYTDEDGNKQTVSYESWVRTIKPDVEFEDEDKEIMKDIFYSADRKVAYDDDTLIARFTLGEVYVGTTSLKDYSDTLSWKEFRTQYILEDIHDFDKTTNGNYLKLVDNNNDGIVEYALRTDYVLDQVVSVNTKDDKSIYHYEVLTDDDDVVTPDGGDVKFELDDVIIYAEIDGKCYAEVVTPVSATIKAISFKDETVTTTDDTVYGQSAIDNDTLMDEIITTMDEQVEYNVYLDKFGFIRAYELAQGSQYGLLTEMYPSRVNNGAYVNNGYWIAELMAGEDKAPAEYNVLNSYYNRNDAWQYLQNSNPFIRTNGDGNAQDWSCGGHPGWNTGITAGWTYGYNYLQEATGHLGMGMNKYSFQTLQFDYDPDPVSPTDQNLLYTNTNVAKFTKTADGVNLYTAAEFAYDRNGDQLFYADLFNGKVSGEDGIYEKYTFDQYVTELGRRNIKVDGATFTKLLENDAKTITDTGLKQVFPVYAVDYIQLNVENIKAGAAHYTIDSVYGDANITNYANTNNYVDAVNDTEFFIVSGRSIQHIVGYKNVPAIAAKNINSIYAVAENVDTDRDGRDYWVANVVVIEVNKEFNYDSVVMAWANPSQASYQAVTQANGQQALSVVDSENAKIDTLIPDYYSWNTMWSNYGFYGVYDSAERDANTLTGGLDRLGVDALYNDNGVYAGTVHRRGEIDGSRAGYIDIDDGVNVETNVYVGNARIYAVKSGSYPTLKTNLSYRELDNNDQIIYVKNAAGEISFIIDTQYYDKDNDSKTSDASWLHTEFNAIIDEQVNYTSDDIQVRVYIDGKLVEMPYFADDTGAPIYRLAGLSNYEAEKWTVNTENGKMVAIDTSLFSTIPNVTIGGKKLQSMIGLTSVDYVYDIKGDTEITKSLGGEAIGHRMCYAVPVSRNGSYVFDVRFSTIGNVTLPEIQKGLVDVKFAKDIINGFAKSVTIKPVTRDSEITYVVTVDFNLKNDNYYWPTVTLHHLKDKKGVDDEALEIKVGQDGYEFRVEFEVKGLQGVQVLVDAKSTENLTYNVTFDTDSRIRVVGGSTSQKYSYTDKEAVELKVVVTDDAYTLRTDTLAKNVTAKLGREFGSNGKWINVWAITVTDVTKDMTVTLETVKIKSSETVPPADAENTGNATNPGDTTGPTA